MRNERLALLVLLGAAGTARAAPGAWFPPSPCDPQHPVVVALLGGEALLSVHYEPGAPPHDVELHRGQDGRYRVPLQEWSAWTQHAPQAVETRADGTREVPLQANQGFAYRIDGCTSELWVDANPDRLQQLRPGVAQAVALTKAGHGGFLNIDGEYGGLAGRDAIFGLFDLGLFLPAGAGRSGFLVDRQHGQRLDSSWVHDDPGNALRLRLGDALSRSPDWESSVRFGGVQWGTDFSLQPDRVTFPLPSVAGSAALPSTAQLYMNGQRLDAQPLQPGQFRFDSVPVLTGAGELSVVIRDASGREQTVVQPFYASPRLLARGLSSFTAEGGFLREGYATTEDRYTRPFAAALLQQGLSGDLTGLGRLVLSQRRQLGGAEGDWILGHYGVLTGSFAGAHTEAGWGGVATLAFERVADPVSLFLRRRIATSAYGDLGREPGSLHFSDSARVSWSARRAGVASLVYVSEQPWRGAGTRLAGLAYNLQLWRGLQSYASWLHPLTGDSGDSMVLGLSLSFGGGTSGGAQWNRDTGSSGVRAYAQHSPNGALGWSWYASGDTRSEGVRQAQAAWATERGTLGAGWAQFDGQNAPAASVQTAIALLDGHAYWTRPVQNSFAVVDAGAVPGVRVYRENQLAGRTGEGGRLLVPDLLPYQPNHLGIDDRDLPMSLGLDSSSATVAPYAGTGVPLHFGVDARAPARFRLADAAGKAVPAGAALFLDGTALPLPVGYDGLVYTSIPDGRHWIEARWGGKSCRARISVGGAEVRVMQACAP